ncbi:hypothetical protein PGT21_024433 [Puccinia graminis f. sp. tritici]|uniref:Uncharacterized protein n=1 Tax=Puccinia graminis f. sp. tritici TaxID=56615 RepID=A0A5B0NZA2_PUCGR|nr:hypothetical protein PGT21_024433 [Puccinia graminis f. sp. tritici]KAA1129043.1 hypothetical protein PGTUg99_025813 [Puccinia graminis f. sp. tritici]
MREGGCARKAGYNSQTKQDSYLLKKANPTEGHPGYYNCLGTDMEQTVCCWNHKIIIPPNSILKAMVVDGTGEMTFPNLCHLSDPISSTWGDPTDCR